MQEDSPGEFSIWVYSDDSMEEAARLLQTFLADPDSPEYSRSEGAYEELLHRRQAEEELARRRYVDLRTSWHKKSMARLGPVTLTLMAISIGVAVITQLGRDTEPVRFLYITDFMREGGYIYYGRSLTDFARGQVWRVFTPMFLHFGIFHILFNMLWLRDLGATVESRHGSVYFAALVLAASGFSNIAQFFVSGPFFGGMSGVVYGLLGFLWIRPRFDRSYGEALHKDTVIMMIIWFFLGVFGVLGGIANTAHGVGLAVGMAWGYLSSGHLKKLFR